MTSWLALLLAGCLAGWLLLLLLVAVWPAGCSLTGWLAAGLLQLLLLADSVVGLLCYGCSLAGSLPGWLDAAVRSLAA